MRPNRIWLWISSVSCAALVVGILLWARNQGVADGLLARETATPTALPTATSWPRTRMDSPEYGLQASLWWHREIAQRDLQLISAAGFGWVKQHVAWREIEGITKGHYNWYFTDQIVAEAEEVELDLLFRLDREPVWAVPPEGTFSDSGPPHDPQDFGDFCHALAARYKGRVKAYQVWNEPNLAREWGGKPPDPVGYIELLRACYIGIKTADPQALVISAGLSPTGNGPPHAMPEKEYLIGMYEAGAARYFDVLGVHAPGFLYPPEVSPEQVAEERDGYSFFCFRHVEVLREIMVHYEDGEKQIAILEMGWTVDPGIHPEYAWFAVTPEQQADYLVRAYKYAEENWSPWISLMVALSIADPDWTEKDEQYWWAITEPGYPEPQVRPAYQALKAMPK